MVYEFRVDAEASSVSWSACIYNSRCSFSTDED